MTDNERQGIQDQIRDLRVMFQSQFDRLDSRLEKSHTAISGTISKLISEEKAQREAVETKVYVLEKWKEAHTVEASVLRTIVYGAVGIILTTFMGAIVALVII